MTTSTLYKKLNEALDKAGVEIEHSLLVEDTLHDLACDVDRKYQAGIAIALDALSDLEVLDYPTLEELVEMLPKCIIQEEIEYSAEMYVYDSLGKKQKHWSVAYVHNGEFGVREVVTCNGETLTEAVIYTLIWLAENGYLEGKN